MEKILCVDNDPDILLLYQEELSEIGYEVLMATSGREALKKYKSERPQLVIMDVRLPVWEDVEALNAILEKDHQPIIINTFPQYLSNFVRLSAEAYLVKSSDLGELKQKVREVLNSPAPHFRDSVGGRLNNQSVPQYLP